MLSCIIGSIMHSNLPQKVISESCNPAILRPDIRSRHLGSIEIGLMKGGDW